MGASAAHRPVEAEAPVEQPVPEVDRNGLRILGRAECLRRLADRTFGRIGASAGALPVILPVNYRLVDESIVFRSAPGTKLTAASEDAVVAFEIDETDPVSHAGWSVLVVGVARRVDDPDEMRRVRWANVPRWAPHDDDVYLAIDVAKVSGREVGP